MRGRISECKRVMVEKDSWDMIYKSIEVSQSGVILSPDDLAYIADGLFFRFLGNVHKRRVLSVGGGVDLVGLRLASMGAEVVSVDLSNVAGTRTRALADEFGIGGNFNAVAMNAEEMVYDNEFDIIVAAHAIHHMDLDKVLPRIRRALNVGGIFVAVEPCCQPWFLQKIHKLVPIHPACTVTKSEYELGREELNKIRSIFPNVEFTNYDFITRTNIEYFLQVVGFKSLMPRLRRLDFTLLNLFPSLDIFCTQVLIKAVKEK
jgi:2-polyprenyl-3-methyl-5-hydroxy-6-metoxy-1,4-benzoquinol methylase